MKNIILAIEALLSIVFCVFTGNAETSPMSQYVTQNGERIKSDYIFGSKAPMTIYLTDSAKRAGTWGYEYQRSDGEYEALDGTGFSASMDSCIIYPEKIDFRSIKRPSYVPDDERTCYRTRVLYNDGTHTYYTYIIFGVPEAPAILVNVSIKCVWDPEYDSIFPESTATFDIISSGATYVELYASSGCLFSPDDKGSYNLYCEQELQCSGRDTVHVIYEDVEWGELWWILVGNDFGTQSYHDMAFSTDYIDDPDILAKIEEYKNRHRPTGMPDIDDDSMDIRQLSKGELYGLTKEADCVSIYDMSGLCRVTERNCSVIDIGSLPQSIYIASIQWTASTGETKVRNVKLKK